MVTFRRLTVNTKPFSILWQMAQVVESTGETSSPKRRRILSGAREVFREVGFERASVDAISARAGVSKATVYSHFQDKAALFVACFSEESASLRGQYLACLDEPGEAPLEQALQTLGERLMSVVVSPDAVALWRHTVPEVARFPQVGRMIFERGPAIAYERIGAYFARWAERGALELADPRAAAVHFVLLVQGDLLVRAQLGILEQPAEALIRDSVRRGVDVFVKAYRAQARP